jgi:hypothetical protein
MKFKTPKITLDGIVTALFIIGGIVAVIGFVWLIGNLIALSFAVSIALGLFVSGVLIMLIAFAVSLATSRTQE